MNQTNQNEAIFSAFIANNLGQRRLDVDDLDIESSLFFSSLKEAMQRAVNKMRLAKQATDGVTIPYIHVDLIENLTLNALAFLSEHVFFIGINHGTVLLLLDMFNRMLSNADVLPQIGGIGNQTLPDKLPHLSCTYADIIDWTQSSELMPSIVPNDASRTEYATLLTETAVLSLVLHEFGHIINGHVTYFTQQTGLNYLLEYNDYESSDLTALSRKAMEWDADTYSAQQTLFHLIVASLDPDKYGALRLLGGPLEDHIIGMWSFATFALFRLMMVSIEQAGGRFNAKYPTPIERYDTAFYGGRVMLAEIKQDPTVYTGPHFLQITDSYARQAEAALQLISRAVIDKTSLNKHIQTSAADQYGQFHHELIYHWNTFLLDELSSHSFEERSRFTITIVDDHNS